jgi:hypothetical protein
MPKRPTPPAKVKFENTMEAMQKNRKSRVMRNSTKTSRHSMGVRSARGCHTLLRNVWRRRPTAWRAECCKETVYLV